MHIWKQIGYKFLWGSCVLGGPYEQIHKTQGGKKKSNFFLFSLGVLQGFSQKSNEDEFSQKSNGGWIFLGIKRGFKNNNNNNVIRLVPAMIESGRGK